MGVKVRGLERTVSELRQTGDYTTRASRRQIRIEAERIRQRAEENAPVLTGALESSLVAEAHRDDRNRLRMTVTFSARSADTGFDYGVYMHEGFYNLGPASLEKQASNPGRVVGRKFLERAYEDLIRGITERMAAALDKL